MVANHSLSLVDRHTGIVETVLVPPGFFHASGDVAVASDGSILWTVTGAGQDRLVKLAPDGSVVYDVGLGEVDVHGLALHERFLWGLTSSGRLLKIAPDTGAVLQAVTLPGAWTGAAAK